jgi:phage/plasmid-like protein (TIGR03299 family)
MAHMIEEINGVAQMAYAGDVPWHGLGKKVPADLTPEQMLDAAGLNWTVEKTPTFAIINDEHVSTGQSALVRSSDNKILDVVSNDWVPVQNLEAFEFFNDFIAAGDMQMNTAGSLRNGQIVWALAKVNESFELFGGDRIDSYLLFSNFHKYGFSTDVRFTPIRVVCNNTLTLSLSSTVERMVKINHRSQFNGDNVKLMLGITSEKLSNYKDMASYLGSKMYKKETLVEYFQRVFPVANSSEKELSRNASRALSVVEGQHWCRIRRRFVVVSVQCCNLHDRSSCWSF